MVQAPKCPEKRAPAGKTDLSEPDSARIMTFRHAIEEGRMEKIQVLLDDGLSTDVDFGGGVTPLHIAVQEGQTDVVRTLLARGADPNAVTRADWTPMHMVTLTGNHEIALLLFEHGAALDRTTMQGHTPLRLANIHKRQGMIALLKKMDRRWWQFWK